MSPHLEHSLTPPSISTAMAPVSGSKAPSTEGSQTVPPPPPTPITNVSAPPPFLVKTYDMVEDSSTDAIVSWSDTNNSFIVWDPPEFGRSLLPKYFKHSNYSSFVRQLNTYGFRKVDPDRWEFANEGFLRGQRHLLRTIARRKPANGQNQQPQQPHGQNSSVGACVEVGTFGLDEEVERLKRDKNVLMQELVRLRQQQQTTDNHLQAMVKRIQGMELRQQQMLSFLARAVNSPGFLSHFVQQQNENSKRLTEGNKKRRFKTDGVPNYKPDVPADGQIVKYQPSVIEAAKALLSQMANSDASPKLESFDGSSDSVNRSDISSELTALDHGSPSPHSSGGTLSEGQPISSHPFYPSVSGFIPSGLSTSVSEIQSLQPGATSDALATAQIPNISSLVGPHELSPASLPSNDINNLDLSKLEEMIPRSDVDNSSLSNGGFLDPTSLNGDQTISLDIDDPSADMVIDWSNPLPEEMQQVFNFDDSSWQQFLDLGLLSANGEAVGSTLENPTQTIEEKPLETEWSEAEMQDLTDQMDLLSSNTKNI